MKKSFYLSGLLAFCFILSSVAVKAQAPVITADPHDTTVCSGHLTRFITHSTGVTSRMWQVLNVSTWDTVHNGGPYSGATTDTLQVMPSVALSGKMYRIIVFASPGSDTSAAATLTVDTLNPGTIVGGMLCLGGTDTLTNAMAGGTWSRSHPLVDSISPTGVVYGYTFGFDTIKYTVPGNTCGIGVASFPIRVDTVISPMPISGPTVTCIGGSIFFSNPNVFGNHVWSVSNGNATIAASGFLTGAAAGLDTVVYTITNGCNTVVSPGYEVLIEAPLPPGTITGPSSVCYGSAIHLTSSVTGGVWISSSTAIANVDGSGNVTGVGQGTAIISYLRTNGCGAFVTRDSVTVYAPVAPIMGVDSVGLGATRTLTDTTWGTPTSWSVSPLDTNITISSAGVVTGIHVGTGTVTYTVSSICGTSMATLVIHVGTPPLAGIIYTSLPGHDTVCVGGTLTLYDTTAQAHGTWSMSNSNALVNPAGVVTGVVKGLDTAIYTVTNAFGTTVTKKVLRVYSQHVDSVKGPTTVAIGGAYNMIGYPAGGTWSSNNDTAGVIINPVTGAFVVIGHGGAIFKYKIKNLCGSDSMNYIFSFPGTTNGVRSVNNTAGSLLVYPNPANGTFTFNLSSDIDAPVSVVITNVVGTKVTEFSTTTNHATAVRLDQPAGLYIITAATDGGTYTSRIMIAE